MFVHQNAPCYLHVAKNMCKVALNGPVCSVAVVNPACADQTILFRYTRVKRNILPAREVSTHLYLVTHQACTYHHCTL